MLGVDEPPAIRQQHRVHPVLVEPVQVNHVRSQPLSFARPVISNQLLDCLTVTDIVEQVTGQHRRRPLEPAQQLGVRTLRRRRTIDRPLARQIKPIPPRALRR
ncbi:hypothetical protein BTO20_37775 (plasmid) [Mycobacterium dioxanotrophicus]|uniref:Uncharacterized protein n=1 Tax=Mycobacterium dioxanotrophicus TaxID=482462 RepID=A0A1Y0CGV4_9MYCO|nr:hypothetical protein BTO20_37775 [Mycobacterium dioxanotrophicus]